MLVINDHAFENIKAINSFTSNSLLDLKSYAFNNGSLIYVNTPNLRSIGSYALANMNGLYKINLGKVYNMEANSVYNLPNLVQIFFTPPEETKVFDQYAFTDVGTLTSNRIRFYVAESVISSETQIPTTTAINVTDTCNRTLTNRRYTYSCTVTVRNNTGHELSNWTTSIHLGNVSFQSATDVSYENSSSSVKFTNTSANGNLSNGESTTFTFVVRSNNNYSSWTYLNNHLFDSTGTYYTTNTTTKNDYLTDIYANSFRTEYKDYFYDYGTILGDYSSSSIPYNIGEYSVILRDYTTKSGETVTGWEIVEYHGANLNSRYILQ